MCVGLRVKHPFFLSDFNKTSVSQQIFEERSNIKFYQNLSSGSRIFPCELMDGQTDMAKLILAFRNFAKAPKKCKIYSCLLHKVD